MGVIVRYTVEVEIAGPDGQYCADRLAKCISRKVPYETAGPSSDWTGIATIARVYREVSA